MCKKLLICLATLLTLPMYADKKAKIIKIYYCPLNIATLIPTH